MFLCCAVLRMKSMILISNRLECHHVVLRDKSSSSLLCCAQHCLCEVNRPNVPLCSANFSININTLRTVWQVSSRHLGVHLVLKVLADGIKRISYVTLHSEKDVCGMSSNVILKRHCFLFYGGVRLCSDERVTIGGQSRWIFSVG